MFTNALNRLGLFSYLAAALWLLALGSSAHAADFTWFGGGTNNNWGNSTNWNFGLIPPTNGSNTDVFMQGPGGTSDLQDFSNNNVNWNIDSLTFDAAATGSWTIGGGQLFVDNFIRNNDNNTHSFNNSQVNLGISFVSIIAANGDIDFNTNVNYFYQNTTLAVSGGQNVYFVPLT